MKISHQRKSPKKLIVVSIVLAVILLAGVIAWFVYSKNNEKSDAQSRYSPTPTEQKQDNTTNADQKQAFLDSEAQQKDGTTNNGQQPELPKSQDVSLSARTDGSNVIVTTKLANLPSGSCKLTITSGSKTVTQQADVMYNPEFSSCAGFSVSKSSIGSSEWTINLSVDTGSSKIEKTITFTP